MGKKSQDKSDVFDYWEYADTPSLYPRRGQSAGDMLLEVGMRYAAKALEVVAKDIWKAYKKAREEERQRIKDADRILRENQVATARLEIAKINSEKEIELKRLEVELEKQRGDNRVNELKQEGENEVNRIWAEAKTKVYIDQNTSRRPVQNTYVAPDGPTTDFTEESVEPWMQLLGEVAPSQDITPDNVEDALSREPQSRKLFGEYLYERDKAYWGARAGIGKSTLAFQCATDLARGNRSEAFDNANTPIPQLVYFFDFETGPSVMMGKQGRLFRQCPPGSIFYKDYVGQFEAGDIKYIGALLVIIAKLIWEHRRNTTIFLDNITALCGESDNCRKVLRNGIDKLVINARQKLGMNVTFVCLAHITEGDDYMLLKKENLRGNSTQITWATSVLLFGKTRNGGRYIKQLKNRQGDNPDEDLVVTTRLEGKKEGASHWVAEDLDYECNVIALKPKPNKTDSSAPVPNSSQLDSASLGSEEENNTKTSYSREKIELTEEQLYSCRDVYEKAISSGKGKKAALEEAAEVVLQGKISYKTLERRLEL